MSKKLIFLQLNRNLRYLIELSYFTDEKLKFGEAERGFQVYSKSVRGC